MTDRELLELAALAAGLKIDKSPYNGGGRGNNGFDVNGNVVLDWHNCKTWNPLADDGDALRLAVKLNMCVTVTKAGSYAEHYEHNNANSSEMGSKDPCAATRRAIVRAAAEIGKSMTGQSNHPAKVA